MTPTVAIVRVYESLQSTHWGAAKGLAGHATRTRGQGTVDSVSVPTCVRPGISSSRSARPWSLRPPLAASRPSRWRSPSPCPQARKSRSLEDRLAARRGRPRPDTAPVTGCL